MNKAFRLGDWVIQPDRNRIRGADTETTIKPRSMAVLVRLAEAEGEVLPRQALMDAVWGDAIVTDDTLTQCIVELRRAFYDSARNPRVIETIRGVGFRLIPPITPVEATSAVRESNRFADIRVRWIVFAALIACVCAVYLFYQYRTATSARNPSVAVLPFDNLSDNSDNQYFADGLAEELVDRLTRVPDLRVSARKSSFSFRGQALDIREIGRRLGVENVIEGSVRRSSEQIRITAQLIDVKTGDHRWSQVYEREISDVFRVQDEISEAIVNALRPSLSFSAQSFSTVGTLDIGAYDLYLLGRHNLAQEQSVRARELFERAVRLDPEFARAYAGIAESLLGFRTTPSSLWLAQQDESGLQRAEWAINKALELNPHLPEAYVALADLHAVNLRVLEEEAALREALSLEPNFVDALVRLASNLRSQGRLGEALVVLEQAAQRDPLNPGIIAAQSRLVGQMRGYEAAIAMPLRLLTQGLESPAIYQALILISSDFGRYAERVRWSLRLLALDPGRAVAMAELADAYMELGEFELAWLWVDRAAGISPAEGFKARGRLLYASGDTTGFIQLVEETFARNPPQDGAPLTLSQASMMGLYSIGKFVGGDYRQAAELLERQLRESPTLRSRPYHIQMYSRAFLALAFQNLGDDVSMNAVVAQSLEIAGSAKKQGIVAYPPLTRELAKAYALLGDHAKALEYQLQAVEQGWRQYFLETRFVADPVDNLLAEDERYRKSVEAIKADLERMRRRVRQNEWDITPEALLSRSVPPLPPEPTPGITPD